MRIAEWKFEAKKPKGETALGPVSFSAWDFTGQVCSFLIGVNPFTGIIYTLHEQP